VSDYDNWNEDTLGVNDSDLVKNLRKEIDRRDKALKERDAEFGKLQDEVRRQSVSNILRDMGVKPKVANLIPKDIDPTADAIKAWVTDYEDIFGTSAKVETKSVEPESLTPSADQADPQGTPNIDPEAAAAWMRMQTSENSTGLVPTGEDAQLAWLGNAANKAGGDADTFFAFLRGEINP
jgi:hypothetical protein